MATMITATMIVLLLQKLSVALSAKYKDDNNDLKPF